MGTYNENFYKTVNVKNTSSLQVPENEQKNTPKNIGTLYKSTVKWVTNVLTKINSILGFSMTRHSLSKPFKCNKRILINMT